MFKIVPFCKNLDLAEFYNEAKKRGFENNISEHHIIGCFSNEKEKQAWILYYNNIPVGSVAAHSFDDVMGDGSYRIAARTCVLTDKLIDIKYGKGLRGVSVISKHQNPTAQFLLPACINWVPLDAKLYITSNNNEAGTQKKVHNIFGPVLQKLNIMQPIKEVIYRNTKQTVWSFDQNLFLKQLDNYPRW